MATQPKKKRAHSSAAAASGGSNLFETSVPFKPFGELLLAVAAHGNGSVLLRANFVTNQLEAGSMDMSSVAIVKFDARRVRRTQAIVDPKVGDTLVSEIAGVKKVVPFLAGLCAKRRAKTTPFLRLVFEQDKPLQLKIESDSGVSSGSYSVGNCKLLHWHEGRTWGAFEAKDFDRVAVAENVPLTALNTDIRKMRQIAAVCLLRICAGDEKMPNGSIQMSTSDLDGQGLSVRVRISRSADSDKAILVRPGNASRQEFTGFVQKMITVMPSKYEFTNEYLKTRLELFERRTCELLRVSISFTPKPVLASVSPRFVAHFYLTSVAPTDGEAI